MKLDKDNHLFSVLFTFAVAFVLVFPLTITYAGTKPIADSYWRLQHYVKALRALGIQMEITKTAEIEAAYGALEKYKADPAKPGAFIAASDEEIVKALEASSANGAMATFFYRTIVAGQERWAGSFTGPGLWGNIALAIGLSADDRRILGMEVLYQVETPGLGGRITEKTFSDQFRGISGKGALEFNLSGQKKDNGFDAISGATITSAAVRDIINQKALPQIDAIVAAKGGE